MYINIYHSKIHYPLLRILYRSMAFIKKLLLLSLHASAAISAGILMLISEVCRQRPSLSALLHSNPALDPFLTSISSTSSLTSTVENSKNTDLHLTQTLHKSTDSTNNNSHIFDSYDSLKREPLYAITPITPSTPPPYLWEAGLYTHHYHPSVQAFITQYINIPYTIKFDGDPIIEFSITSFLNRFAYKNPKSQNSDPSTNGTNNDHKNKRYNSISNQEEPINLIAKDIHNYTDDDYTTNNNTNNNNNIAPDKVFFYKYFSERNKSILQGKSKIRIKKNKNKRLNIDSDDDDDVTGADVAGGSDDEAGVDLFADKLATDMMNNHNRSHDLDDDDYSDDDDEEEEGGAFESRQKRGRGGMGEVEDDEDDEGDGFDMMDGLDDDSDSDGGGDLAGLDDFSDDDEDTGRGKKSKGKAAKRGRSQLEEDSDNDDYDLEVYSDGDDEGTPLTTSNTSSKGKTKGSSASKGSKKMKKGGGGTSDFADASNYDQEIEKLMRRFKDYNEGMIVGDGEDEATGADDVDEVNVEAVKAKKGTGKSQERAQVKGNNNNKARNSNGKAAFKGIKGVRGRR